MAAARKKMRYDEFYIKYGFSMIKVGQVEKPQCILCYEILAETSLKPNKLKRHLQTKHKQYASKAIDYFKFQEEKLLASRLDMSGNFSRKVVARVQASYEVARKIALAKKSHNLGETLILPCFDMLGIPYHFTEPKTSPPQNDLKFCIHLLLHVVRIF